MPLEPLPPCISLPAAGSLFAREGSSFGFHDLAAVFGTKDITNLFLIL